MVKDNNELKVESFLQLKQPVLYLENIEKINDGRLAPTNGSNNLDSPMQIIFSKPRDGTLVRLADSYLEVVFTYNTQSPAGTTNDGADITFENDLVSKMFDTVELVIGGTPIETVYWSNVATEIVGIVCYSSDDDRSSGASFGWLPDYGAGNPEITPSSFLQALFYSFPNGNITGTAANPSVLSFTVPNAGAAALVNAQAVEAVTNTITNSICLSGVGNINQSGYFRRKIFYNKPQAVLSGTAAGTSRQCTLCVPLGHLFQSITSYDKLIYNMNFELRLTRTGGTSSIPIATTSGTSIGRLVYSQVIGTSMGFQTTSLNWIIPQYRLTEQGKALFLKQTESVKEMVCLIRVTPPKLTTSGSTFTYDLGARANVPRYILVGFKNNTVGGVNYVDQIVINRSLYTHAYVTDIFITLGSERYPYSPLQCDFPNNKYAMAYQMFREFCKKMGISTSLDYIDFRDRFPIFCFDLSARPAVLDTNTTSINVQLNVIRNVPAANANDTIDVYAVLICERVYELNYIAGSVTTSQRV